MIESIRRLVRMIRGIASFARLLTVNDLGDLQILQVEGFLDEIRDGVPRIGEWGFASHPPPDTQAVILALGGDRGQLVVIGTEDRETRPKGLLMGETYLYCWIPGPRIGLTPTGSAVVKGIDSTIESTAGNVALQSVGGDVEILNLDGNSIGLYAVGGGNINATSLGGNVVISGNIISLNNVNFSAHTHTIPPGTDTAGGVSGVPA